MWAAETCDPEVMENSQQLHNEYVPPEKKQKQNLENEALQEAIECCKNQELGIEEAATIYGVPKRTLRAKLKNNNFSVIDEKYRVFVLPVFPTEAESDLVKLLQEMMVSQVIFSPIEVRRLGYELVCEKYKISGLPKEKNCLLGQRWYNKFINRYPQLDMEHPLLRAQQEKSNNFYNALEDFVTKYGIDSSRIFSVDGLELKFRASSIDDLKIFHKRKTIYTDAKALCCTSPTGIFIPPVFLKPQDNCGSNSNGLVNNILKFFDEDDERTYNGFQYGCEISNNFDKSNIGTVCDKLKDICKTNLNFPTSEDLANIQKQIKAHLNKKLQPMSEENEEELREKLYDQFSQLRNNIISKYENTLNEVTHEIFCEWFQNFINLVKPSFQNRVLLLLSNPNYVKYFRTLELAKSNGVIFLVLPPHSVHKIHPLDGFSMSLNRNLSTCARFWLGKNPDFKLQNVPLYSLFKKAYSETINPTIAKNGFLYSGIWPIKRNIFESSELGGESVLLQSNSQAVGGSCMITNSGIKSQINSFGITRESDLEKLCRICMKEKMYMKPLFEATPTLGPNYHAKKISEITKMPILPGDGLPGSLCQYCLVHLIDAIKIKNLAVESHRKQLKLRETLDRIYFEDDDSGDKDLLSLFQFDSNQQNKSKIVNRIISKNFEINSMCRICMEEKPLMTSIFFKAQDGTSYCSDICRKIMEVSQCQVHVHDGFSSFICPFCRASVNQASEFIQRVISSDHRFREIITQMREK